MKAEFVDEVFPLIEGQVKSCPSSIEFEMAYQVRVAMDRIRFAIRVTEAFAGQPHQLQAASLQLLDALDRLDSAGRRFQKRFRSAPENVPGTLAHSVNGSGIRTNPGGEL